MVGAIAGLYVNTALVSIPPAHPIKISASSSESRFKRIFELKNPFSRANAPVRPVSSSTVKRHSTGPCSIVLSARSEERRVGKEC